MTQAVALAQQASTGVSQGFKNRIINGAMTIDQRNAGAAVTINTTANVYTLDRWVASGAVSDGVFTIDQDTTAPTGFTNSLKVAVTTADASIGSGQYYGITHWIEGYNVADLGFGTASAKTITISFWVQSSVIGTFGGALANSANSRNYPFTYAISVANTWEYKTVTIAGDTTGTWLTDSGRGIGLRFGFGIGSDFLATAGVWTSSTIFGATGQTQLMSTLSATWYITGVQLEVGSTATSFDYRPYGTELALCQRYYWQAATGATKELSGGWYYSSTQVSLVINMPVPMRTGPTISQTTGTDYYTIYRNGAGDGFNSLTIENAGATMVSLFNETQVSGTAGQAGLVRTTSASSSLGFNAEL